MDSSAIFAYVEANITFDPRKCLFRKDAIL